MYSFLHESLLFRRQINVCILTQNTKHTHTQTHTHTHTYVQHPPVQKRYMLSIYRLSNSPCPIGKRAVENHQYCINSLRALIESTKMFLSKKKLARMM